MKKNGLSPVKASYESLETKGLTHLTLVSTEGHTELNLSFQLQVCLSMYDLLVNTRH